MPDPKTPNPNNEDYTNDAQIEQALGDAEEGDINNLIERAVGNDEEYREPANPATHNALRDQMLEEYYHYNEPRLRKDHKPGKDFYVEKDLKGLMQQIQVVVDEWHREPGGENRNEAVRGLELPLIEGLVEIEIPKSDVKKVIRLLEDFVKVGDDESAKEMAEEFLSSLK